jgi:hypothetical protein
MAKFKTRQQMADEYGICVKTFICQRLVLDSIHQQNG